jgi:hypothetical protein
MRKNITGEDLNRIEKRAIEAMAVAPIIRAVSEKIGKLQALKILQEANEQEAYQRGKSMHRKAGANGIAELVIDVASWGEGGAWEMEVLEQTESTYFFNVTRCPYYEKYKELGLVAYGVELSCCRDEPFARGFNPNLKLVRTQTIMEGDEHCDFRYYLETD